jgi:hypothetical protein
METFQPLEEGAEIKIPPPEVNLFLSFELISLDDGSSRRRPFIPIRRQ